MASMNSVQHDSPETIAEKPIRLFCYGTLLQPDIQLAVFGHRVDVEADTLPGYTKGPLTIGDPAVIALSGQTEHPFARQQLGAEVAGATLLLSATDLARADAYEVSDYERIEVVLSSGTKAYTFVGKTPANSESSRPNPVVETKPVRP